MSDTPSERVEQAREAVAKMVYAAMQSVSEEGKRYPWQDGGNSTMQDIARRKADDIIALARATPAEGTQYATTAELYNDLANELDETRSPEDIARLTAAIHALDPKNPPPMLPSTTPPRSPATVTEVDIAMVDRFIAGYEACNAPNLSFRDAVWFGLTAALTGGRDAE